MQEMTPTTLSPDVSIRNPVGKHFKRLFWSPSHPFYIFFLPSFAVFMMLLPLFIISGLLSCYLIREIDRENKKKEKQGMIAKCFNQA